MGTRTRRAVRLAAITVGFTGVFLAVSAVTAVATLGSGFASTIVARGTYASHGSLRLQTGKDIVVTVNTVQPGGYSGWHSHPGGAIVVVQAGQITTYRSVRNEDGDEEGSGSGFHCVVTTYTAGHSFIEFPGEPLTAVNKGSTVTTLYATFPGVPVNGSPRTDLPNPGTCPGAPGTPGV
jgi:hypothetical protein